MLSTGYWYFLFCLQPGMSAAAHPHPRVPRCQPPNGPAGRNTSPRTVNREGVIFNPKGKPFSFQLQFFHLRHSLSFAAVFELSRQFCLIITNRKKKEHGLSSHYLFLTQFIFWRSSFTLLRTMFREIPIITILAQVYSHIISIITEAREP